MAAPDLSAATHEPRALDPRGWRGIARQWWPVAAGPLLWTLAELAGYWVVEVNCGAGWKGGDVPGDAPARLLAGVIGFAALALLVASMRGPWRAWNRAYDEQAEGKPYGDRHQFMAMASLAWGAAFGLGIAYHAVTAFFIPACARVLQ